MGCYEHVDLFFSLQTFPFSYVLLLGMTNGLNVSFDRFVLAIGLMFLAQFHLKDKIELEQFTYVLDL